jgi:hypothetical protein
MVADLPVLYLYEDLATACLCPVEDDYAFAPRGDAGDFVDDCAADRPQIRSGRLPGLRPGHRALSACGRPSP